MQTHDGKELAQHETLLEPLAQYRYEVRYLPIPLGHTGTIYKSDLTVLTELGTSREEISDESLTCLNEHQEAFSDETFSEYFQCHQKQETSRDTMQAQCTQERLRLVSPSTLYTLA